MSPQHVAAATAAGDQTGTRSTSEHSTFSFVKFGNWLYVTPTTRSHKMPEDARSETRRVDERLRAAKGCLAGSVDRQSV